MFCIHFCLFCLFFPPCLSLSSFFSLSLFLLSLSLFNTRVTVGHPQISNPNFASPHSNQRDQPKLHFFECGEPFLRRSPP